MTQEQFNTASQTPQAYSMPMVVVPSPQGERSYDLLSRLMEENIILVNGPVTDAMATVVCAQLLHLGAKLHSQSNKTISMYIDSPGGSVNAGMSIFDMMTLIQARDGVIIQTIGMGLNASMGSFLLAAGTKGYRAIVPNNEHMIHQPSAGSQGKETDMAITQDVVTDLKDRMRVYYTVLTNMKMEEVEQYWDRDYYTKAEETVKLGIADKILYPSDLIKDGVQYAPGVKEHLQKISDVTRKMNEAHLKEHEDKKGKKPALKYADVVPK